MSDENPQIALSLDAPVVEDGDEQTATPVYITRRPPPKTRGPREKTRRMFTCDVLFALGIVLVPRRGCYVTSIDKEGNVLRDREHDSQRRLYVNRGDRLMVWGAAANDEIALVEVVTIIPTDKSERLRVQVLAGEITHASATVFVVKAGAAA